MKRYNELEVTYHVLDEPEYFLDDVYVKNEDNDSYRIDLQSQWIIDMCKDKKTIDVEVLNDSTIIVESIEVKVRDLRCPFLKNINQNVDEGKYRYSIFIMRGKDHNKQLFNGTYEEGGDMHLNEDCPKCGHLLMVHKSLEKVKSGKAKKCSKMTCDYIDISDIKWKKFKHSKKNYGRGYTVYGRETPIIEMLAKKMPFVLFDDAELTEKFNLREDPDFEEDKDACFNCGTVGKSVLTDVVVKAAKGKAGPKDYKNALSAHYHCGVCGREVKSMMCGDELTAMFAGILDVF